MPRLIEAKLRISTSMGRVQSAVAACRRHTAHRGQGVVLGPRLPVSSNPVAAYNWLCTRAGMYSGSTAASVTTAVNLLVNCTAIIGLPVDFFFMEYRLSSSGSAELPVWWA